MRLACPKTVPKSSQWMTLDDVIGLPAAETMWCIVVCIVAHCRVCVDAALAPYANVTWSVSGMLGVWLPMQFPTVMLGPWGTTCLGTVIAPQKFDEGHPWLWWCDLVKFSIPSLLSWVRTYLCLVNDVGLPILSKCLWRWRKGQTMHVIHACRTDTCSVKFYYCMLADHQKRRTFSHTCTIIQYVSSQAGWQAPWQCATVRMPVLLFFFFFG